MCKVATVNVRFYRTLLDIHIYILQVNGVNLLRVHSTHPYGYALTLVDTLFTREEQSQCLMFKSKKSEKPGLDPARVEKILGKFFYIKN